MAFTNLSSCVTTKLFSSFLLVFCLASNSLQAQELPSIPETVANASLLDGYFNLYWDENSGKLYWEIDKLDTEFLYQISMASGLGSNPIGIDRGQLRGTYVLSAQRIGPRVLLVEPNYRYRASSDNELERQAVEDAFARQSSGDSTSLLLMTIQYWSMPQISLCAMRAM